MFPQTLMNDLTGDKFKEIDKLQDIIKTDDINYKAKSKKVHNFNKYYLPSVY